VSRTHIFGPPADDARLAELQVRAIELARVFRGARVETKPSSVALHYRDVHDAKQEALVEMFRMACIAHRARPLLGRKVVEGRLGQGDKGAALEYIVSCLPRGTALVYVGDDVTDEPALSYAHRHPLGLALHVVSDERVAPRVHVNGWLAEPAEWLEILEALAQVRMCA
jgi:trehalose 6-phosphate phosphatase